MPAGSVFLVSELSTEPRKTFPYDPALDEIFRFDILTYEWDYTHNMKVSDKKQCSFVFCTVRSLERHLLTAES